MREPPVHLSPRMVVLVEVQTDVVPFLRDNHYPWPKLLELEEMLQAAFDAGEIMKRNGPKKGKGGRPRKVMA